MTSPAGTARSLVGASGGTEGLGRRRIRAYIGLGANVGDAAATLARAVRDLGALPGVRVRGVSRLYLTAPWGVTDQPDFHNAAVALDITTREQPEAAALTLLAGLKALERDAGRRQRARWGPRELDLDLLIFGRHRIVVERPPEARSVEAEIDPAKAARQLEVPHRDLGERLFVLAPLADLAPGLVPPGWHEPAETARDRVASQDPSAAARAIGEWDSASGRWRRR
ncbi:MAG: 2-amino-4-hydroxy-6-hydroxymethyldihydropteridine diphosphokinase [Candidatus Limnocylindrales bacterium]